MKRTTIADIAKDNGWPTVTAKIDKEFEKALVDFLRGAKAPHDTQVVAAHFSKPVKEVERYLERLTEQKLARFVYVGRGLYGWEAVPPDNN